ncbi:ABC transporter permease [Polynucleobacter necessarius]|uniref:ABC transporter permease n=1 Tax=Polynucleobacter necessarius TaxID=576610 RepID=UPI0018D4F3C8|nr:FtsX-like permease family protein [Polynucleobacter necessarius]
MSVAALTSVSFLADRLHCAFEFDARQLIAADLLIAADQALPEAFIQEAELRGLQIAQTIVFPSMASTESSSKLASIKAVSATYPLRGQLTIKQSPASASPLLKGPKSGTVWVEPALLNNLDTQAGQMLRLGDRQFVIAGVITQEIDRGAGFMNFAPRIMMSLDDLPSTGLIGLGSRVTYRLLLAGDDAQVKSYQLWLMQEIDSKSMRGIRVETLETAQPTMRKTLDKAEQFLSLVSLLTAMIAAVAIGLSAHRYMQKQADVCAVLKCFGATRAVILRKQMKTLVSLGLIATLLGALLAYLAQNILTVVLGSLLLANLPDVSVEPILWSALFAWILLIGFASYPLTALIQVSPIRLIRKEFEVNRLTLFWILFLGLGSCSALIWIAARDWKLALWVAISCTASIAAFAAISYLVLWITSKLTFQDFAGRFAVIAIGRRPGFAILQITALGVAIMALLMILILRQDLLKAWQANIPADAPNRFMINIQEDQKGAISKLLESRAIATPHFYPMVRGRLIQVNGSDVSPADYAEENAKRLLDREFNLSYTNELPQSNQVVSGKWIEGDTPQISIETGIAKTLRLKQGDMLTFEVAGEQISAPITSLRQIQEVLDKLSGALGLLFAFTIVAAILVLLAALSATQDVRYRNAALLKAMGASRAPSWLA